MKNIFKIELRRAFINRLFIISVLIGSAICIFQIFEGVIPMLQYQDELVKIDYYPHSVFNKWIGNSSSFGTVLFFAVIPILAALPFADSLFSDRKSGYVKNVFTREKRKNYYVSKFIVVFLSGGCAVVVPLLLNLYITSLFLPCITPDSATGTYNVTQPSEWSDIFHTNPFLYILIYLIIIFVTSGFLATIALSASFFIKYRYVVLLIPFIVYQLITFISKFLVDFSLDMQVWLNPSQVIALDFKKVLAEMIILIFLILSIYFIKVKRDETY